MATDQADSGGDGGPSAEERVAVGAYTWTEFMREHGHGNEADAVYPDDGGGRFGRGGDDSGPEFDGVSFDPEQYLGFDPAETGDRIGDAAGLGKGLREAFETYLEETPVAKDEYLWEHFKWEHYYDAEGNRPRDGDGEVVPFDESEHLGFDADDTEGVLAHVGGIGEEMAELVDRRTVNVNDELDEDEFFSDIEGHTTLVNRYDLEKEVPLEKKLHFREIDRYWANKPYSYVVIFHSDRENEKKYYVIEPYRNSIEMELQSFLTEKLRAAIKYASDDVVVEGGEGERRDVIERETRKLLERYELFDGEPADLSLTDKLMAMLGRGEVGEQEGGLDGIEVRPEPVVIEEDDDQLSQYQVEKLLYYLKRNFIGYERIDGIKHDINVEDISCDGYNRPVFVYHTDYEQIISNIEHGEESLDDFVVKLAQRSGKGISKRQPQVDATLPDGSRAQLTLGREVSDHGTNYTIRQFKDVPFTPIDLINWKTFSLEEMAFIWLSIENEKSLIFAGGTASGKTTSLNAVSLFIPSNTKIVSIEDTREVELPQRNWIASVTRPSFSEDERGDIDEFDLLEAALRQRPDYIVMGEVRGEEGRTLFQVMSTGHTTYTTFHADSVAEVLKRFTTDPINVSKTLFTALDLVSIQRQTRVGGKKVRRNSALTEINHYDAENDEINVQDVYQWIPENDDFEKQPGSNTLEEIAFDRGWSHDELQEELFKRRVVLAYLIDNGLNTYAQVAASIQAFIQDQDTVLTLIANDQLEESLENLREMESVFIDVEPEKEEMVPRPDPTDEVQGEVDTILERAEAELFEEYRGDEASDIALALSEAANEEETEDVVVDSPVEGEMLGPEPEGAAGEEMAEANGGSAGVLGEPVDADSDGTDGPPDAEADTGEGEPEGANIPPEGLGADSLDEEGEEGAEAEPDDEEGESGTDTDATGEADGREGDDGDGFGVFEDADADTQDGGEPESGGDGTEGADEDGDGFGVFEDAGVEDEEEAE